MMLLSEPHSSEVSHLDFVLPAFLRIAWASDRAREVWEPRIARIASCWRKIEWRTVVDGVRRCALLWLSHDELVALAPALERYRLRAVPLASNLKASAERAQNVLVHRVAIGRRGDASRFRKAWIRGDDDVIGQYLGYPECCRAFFRKTLVEDGWLDPTWPRAAGKSQSRELQLTLDMATAAELNLFWSPLGIRLVPHVPCSHVCNVARELAMAFVDSGRRAGYGVELDHALDVLQWPVEWSALHGIAEIKTPIVKLSTRTDATPRKLVLRYRGESYPEEGAHGIRFPYAAPARVTANRLKVVG